ncbi:MAG: PilZ domain-containing protein [Pseudomonadota bacterium]
MERRQSKRWIQEEEVVCYFEGDRLGAHSKDLSRTGMFVATAKSVPLGGRIALIFRPRFAEENPIYLVGEVARLQKEPVPGLGVQWVKAITDASPLQLSNLLRDLLDVDAGGDIEDAEFEVTDGAVSSFVFPAARRKKKTSDKKKSVVELLDMLNVEVVHSDDYKQRHPDAERAPRRPWEAPQPRPRPQPEMSGPITMRVDNQKVYAPCKLPGSLVIQGVQRQVIIRGLATWGLFVETDAVPPEGSEVGMIFELKTKSGDARLVLRCNVVAQKAAKSGWAAGLDLKITDPGDPLGAALLKRYVRWLHFSAVADD